MPRQRAIWSWVAPNSWDLEEDKLTTMTNDNEDPWLARDKLYHVMFSLYNTNLFYTRLLHSLPVYPPSLDLGRICHLSRRRSRKRGADHLGIFLSAGASSKDAMADLLGFSIAAFVLSIWKRWVDTDSNSGQTRRVLPV